MGLDLCIPISEDVEDPSADLCVVGSAIIARKNEENVIEAGVILELPWVKLIHEASHHDVLELWIEHKSSDDPGIEMRIARWAIVAVASL